MIRLGSTQPNEGEQKWRRQLDQFVKTNQKELAALTWGLYLEQEDGKHTLGIDLKPTPHFVYCPNEAIEALNNKVENQIQEILGLIDHHDPKQEVLILGIGNSQLKLFNFTPDPSPPDCFEQVGESVDALLERLEQRLIEQIES